VLVLAHKFGIQFALAIGAGLRWENFVFAGGLEAVAEVDNRTIRLMC
jgi:hypothetical protein